VQRRQPKAAPPQISSIWIERLTSASFSSYEVPFESYEVPFEMVEARVCRRSGVAGRMGASH